MGDVSLCPKRRNILKLGIGLGVQLRVANLADGQETPAAMRPKEGDLLVKVDDAKAIPLTADDIPLGADQTMAWAMDPVDKTIRSGERLNRILLLRFPPDQLGAETKPRAAEGVVAYTAALPENAEAIEQERLRRAEELDIRLFVFPTGSNLGAYRC